ncbi:MAG: sigma-70 family RNA polymerase sigma factor [Actinomycetota bacterium]|nr:sigma-70 family RNA polymerase sigma factor [Actinomycetota bacterium]
METEATDEELMAAMARGERRALEELYRRHAGWLGGRLARATSSRELAEEALQDSFLAAWRKPGSYRGEGDVGAWLWGIARRRLATLGRKRVDVPSEAVHAPAPAGPDEQALANVDAAKVRDAVSRLPDEQRDVVERVVFRGQPLVDVARCLGIPVGTLKSRLHRARLRIRAEVEA